MLLLEKINASKIPIINLLGRSNITQVIKKIN